MMLTFSGRSKKWLFVFFFFKQKTAYEMRISDWSSDVCSSDLLSPGNPLSSWRSPIRMAAAHRQSAQSGDCSIETALQVCEDVLRFLEPDRQPQQIRTDARRRLRLGRHAAMGHGGRLADQCREAAEGGG